MMGKPPLLWVTRSSPFNLLTAQRLRGMGHDVVIAPLFDIQPLEVPDVGRPPDLIAFTSVNGVRHHPFRADWATVPAFAVGDATAAAARRCGYVDVRSADGNLQDLQALILRSTPSGKRLIHFSAEEPAGDLAAYLRFRGFDALRYSVYKTVPVPLQQVRAVLTDGPRIDGIVIHSPKAGRRVADVIADTSWTGRIFCLSTACAQEFHGTRRVTVESAPRPTERSFMELIRQAAARQDQDVTPLRPRGSRIIGEIVSGLRLKSANDNVEAGPTPA